MARFLQVDDVIVIDKFSYPLEEFLIDQPSYVPLQAPYVRRIYMPNKGVHRLHTENKQRRAPEGMNYPDGDAAIANKKAYRQAYKARLLAANPPEPTPTDDELLNDFNNYGPGKAAFALIYKLMNDVRSLQGLGPLTRAQFRARLKATMR